LCQQVWVEVRLRRGINDGLLCGPSLRFHRLNLRDEHDELRMINPGEVQNIPKTSRKNPKGYCGEEIGAERYPMRPRRAPRGEQSRLRRFCARFGS